MIREVLHRRIESNWTYQNSSHVSHGNYLLRWNSIFRLLLIDWACETYIWHRFSVFSAVDTERHIKIKDIYLTETKFIKIDSIYFYIIDITKICQSFIKWPDNSEWNANASTGRIFRLTIHQRFYRIEWKKKTFIINIFFSMRTKCLICGSRKM